MTDGPGGKEVLERGETYLILKDGRAIGGKTILCLRCDKESYSDGDVANRYCANCDLMHEHGRPRTPGDCLPAAGARTDG